MEFLNLLFSIYSIGVSIAPLVSAIGDLNGDSTFKPAIYYNTKTEPVVIGW
ncbi:MAG: hypothetical protein AB8V79_05575 [Candidatus Midichloria sp.]